MRESDECGQHTCKEARGTAGRGLPRGKLRAFRAPSHVSQGADTGDYRTPRLPGPGAEHVHAHTCF